MRTVIAASRQNEENTPTRLLIMRINKSFELLSSKCML